MEMVNANPITLQLMLHLNGHDSAKNRSEMVKRGTRTLSYRASSGK